MTRWILVLMGVGLAFVMTAGAGCPLFDGIPVGDGTGWFDDWGNNGTDEGENSGQDINDGSDDGTDDGTDDGSDDGNADGNDDGGNDDGGGNGGLTFVKTAIPVRHDAGLQCGNDLIAFGTETADSSIVGVSYVIPSQNPTAGTPVTNSSLYDNSDFAVGGRNIFLAGKDPSIEYQVRVFNVDTGVTSEFTAEQIHLPFIPVDQSEPGNLRADGNYCAVLCDTTAVTDQKHLKVIDASTNPPTLIAFDNTDDTYHQVDVDAATGRVVAVAYDKIYIFSIANPTAAPSVVALPNAIGDMQVDVSGDYLIGMDDASYGAAFLVNLATATYIPLTDSLATWDVAIGGTQFAFFANWDSDDSVGAHARAAVGTVPGPSFAKAALEQYIDGSYTSNGQVGFGQTTAVRPDGSYIFIAGAGDIGTGNYLQYSTGGVAFTVPADSTGGDSYGVPATDVSVSANTLGFKTGTDTSAGTNTTLGYAVLN